MRVVRVVIVFIFIVVVDSAEEGCRRQLAVVARNDRLRSPGEAAYRLGGRNLRSLVEDNHVEQVGAGGGQFRREQGRHCPARADSREHMRRLPKQPANWQMPGLLGGFAPYERRLVRVGVHHIYRVLRGPPLDPARLRRQMFLIEFDEVAAAAVVKAWGETVDIERQVIPNRV